MKAGNFLSLSAWRTRVSALHPSATFVEADGRGVGTAGSWCASVASDAGWRPVGVLGEAEGYASVCDTDGVWLEFFDEDCDE